MSIELNNTVKVVQQNQVEEDEMIGIVLPIHIKDKKVRLEEDLIEKVKFVGECIEQQLGKSKSYLIIVHFLKSSSPRRMYKRRKLMKYGFFKVLRRIDEKDHKFELKDDMALHYKFHPADCIQTRGQVFF